MSRLTPLAQRLTLFIAFLFTIFYFVTALPRLGYPYDLDFLEDSTLMQVQRVAQGQGVYIPPSIEFMAHLYMPVYFWIGAGLVNLFGLSFLPLRLLSFTATLITTGLIFYITRRESGQTWLAFACAGLYLGGYRLSGFWYDLARVDSLFVALSLSGATLGFYARNNFERIAAIIVLVLAFLTKQTGLAFGVGLLGYWLLNTTALLRPDRFPPQPRANNLLVGTLPVLALALLYFGLCFGLVYWFNLSTDGWFAYYAFSGATNDPVEIGRVLNYIGLELFGVMFGLSALAVATVWQVGRRTGVGDLRREGWLWAIGAAAVISGVARASVGGNLNNLMTVYAFLCLTPALFWKTSCWGKPVCLPQTGPTHRSAPTKELLIVSAILLQFALGAYNPLRYIPTTEMRTSGDQLIERIRAIDGEVYVMMHPYYAVLAGKEPSAQLSVLWHDFHWRGLPPPTDLIARIENQYYAAIISDESLFETDPAIQELLRHHYPVTETLPPEQSPLSPMGLAVRPIRLYLPK